MAKSIFKAGRKYTFSDYFKMACLPEEILAEFGYSFAWGSLKLPMSQEIDQSEVERLRASYYRMVGKVSLNSETAKREMMVAPLLHSVVQQLDVKLSVEYPLNLDEKLSGSIDYLFRAKHELVVIEAKKGDLEQGFNQLAAEMVAVDKYEEPDTLNLLYGAITIGEMWRFAVLERDAKRLVKDFHTFRFPEDLEQLFAILTGILS
jgi:hypothetical protein